ncbi:hypothetical protein CW736_00960 [Nonlabens sp. MB-3u-79]|jgi:hypothetical protein|uniref:hypothetical protein n=1 Tax=Nonlabens sp. MB-3u-79 TaxID=2058134 RepID=UPI000C30DE67|nr:hypothetical protein [Nonlabens sp. MB-3u-79]AUC78070.1 hypothetical protein CW736_00960 [Nonlabens sp. MB-3u-79]
MKERLLITTFLLLLSIALNAQVGINTAVPDTSSMLDISSFDKGILIPRLELQSTTDVTSIVDPANSLLVFNLVAVNDVSVGYYYWSTPLSKWIKIIDQQDQSTKFGTLFATFVSTKTQVQTDILNGPIVFNYASTNRYNTIEGASLSGNDLTLPPGDYIVESSVYIASGSFDYILRINTVQNGLIGTMASVKTQIEIVQQKQIAVFTTTETSTVDFIATDSSGEDINGFIDVNPDLSYLKITKL